MFVLLKLQKMYKVQDFCLVHKLKYLFLSPERNYSTDFRNVPTTVIRNPGTTGESKKLWKNKAL